MKCYRVELRWKDPESSAEDKIFIDAFLDDDDLPHRELRFLGWMTADGGEVYPFRLENDGTLDFGSGFEPSDRWSPSNFRTKRVRVEEYATFEFEGQEYAYQIVRLTELTAL